MSYLPAATPLPDPEPWERKFWEFCDQRTLRFQSCARCGVIRHPPMPVCASCQSVDEEWCEAQGGAELYTYTIVHHPNHPALAQATPYNAALVIFPQMQGVRLVSNIVDCRNEDLRIGMKLSLVWEEPVPGRVLPRFRPRGAR